MRRWLRKYWRNHEVQEQRGGGAAWQGRGMDSHLVAEIFEAEERGVDPDMVPPDARELAWRQISKIGVVLGDAALSAGDVACLIDLRSRWWDAVAKAAPDHEPAMRRAAELARERDLDTAWVVRSRGLDAAARLVVLPSGVAARRWQAD
ncbi:hypothetical protein D5S17_29425 [Pseudonocardiaceae bacterium YIM PH 21723]|nr:hypothetical protein D5S17_29425 [Pseudonocardiaceae bacterium YIM PH 21723]